MYPLRNPFSKTVVNDDEPFCNQQELLRVLLLEARSGNNNVLLAPRRSGKTSLAKRVIRDYRATGGLATLADLSSVPSVDAAADRIATALFSSLSLEKKLFQSLAQLVSGFAPNLTMNPDGSFTLSATPTGHFKSGLERLVSVVESFDRISAKMPTPLLVVFDEFQDLALLQGSAEIEAALRTVIQHQKVSYLFVGSRRQILRDMFESPKRAFYRGATMRNLPKIIPDEFISHLMALVKDAGALWQKQTVEMIVSVVRSHTYSVTAVAHALYEATAPRTPTLEEGNAAVTVAAANETTLFVSMYASLSPHARLLLEALAVEPTKHPMAGDFIRRHRLSTPGTVSKSLITLKQEDHVEIDENGTIVFTDPLFERWMNTRWRHQIVTLQLPIATNLS